MTSLHQARRTSPTPTRFSALAQLGHHFTFILRMLRYILGSEKMSVSRDSVKYGVLAGLGATALGGGLYWLLRKMKKANNHIFLPVSTQFMTIFMYRSLVIRTRRRKSTTRTWHSTTRRRRSISPTPRGPRRLWIFR